MRNHQADTSKGNILVVDDAPADLRLLSQMLSEQGYRVRPVRDGSLALESARAAPPDLILLDIKMSGMDGYEVCKRLKADERTRDVPIIFISTLHEIEDKVKAFAAGGVDYVTKPFQFEEVLARVEIHLALQDLTKQLKVSLAEKELLLREIYHRTKNNLQLVVSLLSLQSDYVKDEKDAEMFRESQNRVMSMAVINEMLYRSTDLKRFDFAEYVGSLTRHLFRSYNVSGVELLVDIENVFLDVEQAIPCGLIINELVSNALKHAFSPLSSSLQAREIEGGHRVRLEMRRAQPEEGDKYILVVSDNGVGFPEDVDFRNTESLGLRLVVALAKQLKGEIELDRSEGTIFKITFAVLD